MSPSGNLPDEPTARLAAHAKNLGRLYPMLAHELFAYLNTMVLNLELLQRAAADAEPGAETMARVRRHAAVVSQELSVFDRMLKAVVGQARLSEEPSDRFDFRLLCEDLALVFDAYARQRRVQVRTTLADVPMIAVGDRDAMRHAMTALLLAAFDALPHGASVSLSLRGDHRLALFTMAAELAEVGPVGAWTAWTREMDSDMATVRENLASHGARLTATSKPHEPARLEIEMPLAPIGA